jgi:hypothetical protein
MQGEKEKSGKNPAFLARILARVAILILVVLILVVLILVVLILILVLIAVAVPVVLILITVAVLIVLILIVLILLVVNIFIHFESTSFRIPLTRSSFTMRVFLKIIYFLIFSRVCVTIGKKNEEE